MTKPLGYYAHYAPGEGGLLEEMTESWGPTFHELNNSERLWMLSNLVGIMTADRSDNYEPLDVSDDITPAIERFHELSFSLQLALAEALINQIKSNRRR